MLLEILNRRSIRKYKSISVDKIIIEEILKAGILAPSSKNRQPWKFVVVMEKAKYNMIQVMKNGLKREKENPLLPESSCYLNGAENTLKIMEQAPVIIFIVNRFGIDIHQNINPEKRINEICDVESIGAAVENMALTAVEHGLGSLWICDTYFAYDELKAWLNTDGEIIAAMTIGYADEVPYARPRNKLNDIVEWRT